MYKNAFLLLKYCQILAEGKKKMHHNIYKAATPKETNEIEEKKQKHKKYSRQLLKTIYTQKERERESIGCSTE